MKASVEQPDASTLNRRKRVDRHGDELLDPLKGDDAELVAQPSTAARQLTPPAATEHHTLVQSIEERGAGGPIPLRNVVYEATAQPLTLDLETGADRREARPGNHGQAAAGRLE
jgi:hypothetical protein